MAVTTSQVTTSANGDLALNPNGTGGVKFTKLATAAMPVGVKADGTVQHFKISELASGGTLASTDTIMVQKTSETTTKKSTLAEVLAGAGGLTASSLSVTTGTPKDGGELAYNNAGVFTFKPASLSDLGGITLASLSVTPAGASGGGSLTYSPASGVFTFAPADLSSVGGIALTDLSVAAGTTVAGGSLSYSAGVFTFGKSLAYTGVNGIGFKSGSTTDLEIKITTLTTR